MTDAKTPDAPEPETIIELIETVNVAYVILAFVIGAAIVAGAVLYLGREKAETE
jgi:hypothetical protein